MKRYDNNGASSYRSVILGHFKSLQRFYRDKKSGKQRIHVNLALMSQVHVWSVQAFGRRCLLCQRFLLAASGVNYKQAMT